MLFKRTYILFISILLVSGLVGVKSLSVAQGEGDPVITAISVQEVNTTTEIQIDSNLLPSYTVYKPADPYRVVVELQGVGLGNFRENIMVDRAGVMEIIPSQLDGAVASSKLEIILTVPAEVKPVQSGNTIILSFYNPEAEEFAAPPAEAPAAMPEIFEEEALEAATMVENIELSKSKGMVYVRIRGNGKMNPESFQPADNRLVVDIPDTSTMVESLKTYEPPVFGIRVGGQPDKTRLVLDIDASSEFDIRSEGNEVIIAFEGAMSGFAGAMPEPVQEDIPMAVKASTGYGSTKEYSGEVISLDIQDAPLSKIFGIIAEVSGYNIVISPQVKDQRVFIKLDNVPWDLAMDVILRNYGLSKSIEGTIIRVAPTKIIAEEENAIAKAKEASFKAGDLETRMYPINFAEVSIMKKLIDEIIKQKGAGSGKQRGTVSVDQRTNTLIVRDVPQMHSEFERIIQSLDTPTRQVSIEVKIVEVTTNFTRDLGIQWGASFKPTPNTEIGGTGQAAGSGFSTGNPFIINLPSAVGAGSGGALGFGYLGADSLRALDIQLSAMESSGNGKIISNPRIITLDNQEATIEQGKKIPYQTVSAEGTQTQFVDANLELNVTPHITPDGTIVMDIETKKNEADFANSVQGVPTINTNEANSQVLINDGDTLVMGGIFTSSISQDHDYVPALGKIPVLGWLFKKKKIIDDTTELLIFLTPRILK
jgi:type IV pilus assembly protein PilQ